MHIYYEQLELLATQTRQGAIANLLAGLVVTIVLYSALPLAIQIPWILSMLLVGFLRITHANHIPATDNDELKVRWVKRYSIILLSLGLIWGSLAIFTAVYASFFNQLFLLSVILGITSAGITTMAIIIGPFVYYLAGAMG